MQSTPVQPVQPLSSLSIHAPFGEWPLDTARDQCTHTPHGFIIVLQGQDHMVKLFDHDEDVEKELGGMKLAEKCSVTPVGRVFNKGWFSKGRLCGFVMPHFTSHIYVSLSADPPHVLAVDVTKDMGLKISIIHQLRDLVSRLHENHIIHGDITPSNLLICSHTKELWLSNFRSTCHQDAAQAPKTVSWRYASPYLAQQVSQAPGTDPVSIERDLYATGISMWEIYTGNVLFGHINDEDVRELLRAGTRPDTEHIHDEEIVTIINDHLERGNRPPQVPEKA